LQYMDQNWKWQQKGEPHRVDWQWQW